MNKKFIYYFVGVCVISALPFTTKVLLSKIQKGNEEVKTCAPDKKVCPDDSTVIRILPTCEFQICPTFSTTTNEESTLNSSSTIPLPGNTQAASSAIVNTKEKTLKLVPAKNAQTVTAPVKESGIISKITAITKSIVETITSPFVPRSEVAGNPNDASIPASSYITLPTTENTSVYKTLPPQDFAGQKYLVKDNNILSNDNKVIYTIPPEVISAVSSSNAGWTNTTINVVPIGNVAPILPNNAIPIKDLPGKYYLSENSFGSIEACEFSNKIFILDITTNTVTLMYEENSSTLSRDDPRACNSEIFLLATEGNNLILKYHTIGTNTLCDSAWSEPDKTYYLDVTKLQTEGMKHYIIPENLSATAEQEEAACRAKL